MLLQEVQADKLYLGKANMNLIKDCHVDCYNHPLGRPPKDENDRHAEDKKRAIGERNEVEATFGTSKGFTGQTTSGRNLTTRLTHG